MEKMILLSILVLMIVPFSYGGDTWEFEYPGDAFTEDALVDLRYLNEDVAGEKGYISLSKDGNSFVRGDGEPMRIWAVNGGTVARRLTDEDLAYYARFLAKMGVNMIRYHGSVNPAGKGTQITDVDTMDIHHIHRLVAAMKKEGIYVTISPFWPHNGHMGDWVPEEWGIEGYSGKDALWGVIYFNELLQEGYKAWVKELYTKVNPFTGIPLKDDPAVGLIQIMNEDGVFFWTMQNIKPELKAIIVKKYSKWLIDKYGSLEKALAAWDGFGLPEDNPQNKKLDIFRFYDLTIEKAGGEAKRVTDEVEFYTHIQYSFYKNIHDYYRNELGCKHLINANNWKTGNGPRLNDLERYSNTSCKVLAVNRYYVPNHVGENNGWRIDPGHYYKPISCLKKPAAFPINIKQVDGYPMLMTESGWNTPQRYMSESVFLISAYMSLTGVDAYYWFCPTAKAYDENPYFTWETYDDGQHPMHRWTCSLPGMMGMFPANALSYRLGYVKQGENVIYEERTLKEMYERKLPLISEEVGFDPNRDQGFITDKSETEVTPLAYLAGPVMANYEGDPKKTYVNKKLDRLIDSATSSITSISKELEWNYSDGLCVLNTTCSKGVTGFVQNQKSFDLDGVVIESQNDYASINVVSMDQKPITKSRKILIQVGTRYEPTGWKEEKSSFKRERRTFEGFKILNTGEMPWQCVNTDVTVEIENKKIKKAVMLNSALYAVKEVGLEKMKKGIRVVLPKDAMYVVLLSK